MVELYSAGSRLGRVRFIMILSLISAVASIWSAYDIFTSLGLSPGDGGQLKPFGTRLIVALVILLLGFLFAWGMWVYGKSYLRSVSWDPNAQILRLRTLGMFADGRQDISPQQVISSTFQRGKFVNPGGVSVDAPWVKVKVQGKKLPYILDARGQFHDPALLQRLLKA